VSGTPDTRRGLPLLQLKMRLATAIAIAALLAPMACARRGVVEAPMTSADASAAALALGRPAGAGSATVSVGAPARELPIRVGDRWTGTYTCNQGNTELVLVVERVEAADSGLQIEAIFEFHYLGNGGAYAAASGSARMRGSYDAATKRLRLDGDQWIDQPPNYRLVNLVGTLDKMGAYAGTVEGPGCTRFSATRD
jgi:hypothetical protein